LLDAPGKENDMRRAEATPVRRRRPLATAARKRAPAAKASGKARAPRALALYNAKRNFGVSAEPRGEKAKSAGHSFVIQQHDATRMHYDFRLELDGVLLSWAVPKGPSLDPSDKRLAVQTEDHPVSYKNFEGNIPEGEYGGGPVIVWDRGTWTPEGDARAALKKGHLTFTLDGEKLQGRFSLVRLRGPVAEGPKSNWLLMKRSDEHVRSGKAAQVTLLRPESVITGRTVQQVGTGEAAPKPARKTKGARATPPKPTAARMPKLDHIEPQLATLVDRPPDDRNWVYEIKFDGYRMMASIDHGKVQLRSRNNLDWTSTLPDIAKDLGKLRIQQAIIDGELCYIDEQGRSSFQHLQNALPRGLGKPGKPEHLVFYVFDVLFQDGADVRQETLLERKQRLRLILGSKPPARLRYSDHLEADGRTALLHACSTGLEGLIAKRPDAPYRSGRGRDWLKLKCQQRQEFVIVGMIRASGTRQGFRSLVLATRDGGGLKYAGRVGTGFSVESLRQLAAMLAPRSVEKSPLADPPRLPGVTWVKPDLVCEIEYTEMTADGSLRHPSFQGLRQDKSGAQVQREKPLPVAKLKAASTARPAKSADTMDGDSVGGVRISHPDRVMDAASGLTKLELARYHEQVSGLFMPYATNRPLALVRCPQGDAHQCFFQKHKMPGVGPHVQAARIAGQEVLYVDEPVGVLELVQFNVVEFHGWGVSMSDPRHPDWIVVDLDPDTSLKFSDVVDAALEVRDALAGLKLKSWVKTTGGKGLHVVVPLQPRADWTTVKDFAQAVARTLEQQNPARYVATMSKARRAGKIFVDYLRNGEGATAVLPYSPRSRPGAPVAMPVAWKDIAKLDPKEFTLRKALAWLRKRKADPWKDFLGTRQRLPG